MSHYVYEISQVEIQKDFVQVHGTFVAADGDSAGLQPIPRAYNSKDICDPGDDNKTCIAKIKQRIADEAAAQETNTTLGDELIAALKATEGITFAKGGNVDRRSELIAVVADEPADISPAVIGGNVT